MREDANEAIVIRRFAVEVRVPLLSGEENRLQRSSTPVCLAPALSSLSSVRAQSPTLLVARAELGNSITMPQTFLSAKKSSPVNCILLKSPFASKKKGSLSQPAKKRQSPAFVPK
jgi:hypothetical protein